MPEDIVRFTDDVVYLVICSDPVIMKQAIALMLEKHLVICQFDIETTQVLAMTSVEQYQGGLVYAVNIVDPKIDGVEFMRVVPPPGKAFVLQITDACTAPRLNWIDARVL